MEYQGDRAGQQYDVGSNWVGRVEAEQYDLAQQRGDQQQAGIAFGRLLALGFGRIFNR